MEAMFSFAVAALTHAPRANADSLVRTTFEVDNYKNTKNTHRIHVKYANKKQISSQKSAGEYYQLLVTAA